MLVILAIAALAILACVVVVSLGRGGELTEFPPDVPPLDLPEAQQLTAVDFMALRLPVNLVGYHTQTVDETLRRAAGAISARDTRIAVLEQRVSELLASRLYARQEAYATPGAGPRTDHEPEAPAVPLELPEAGDPLPAAAPEPPAAESDASESDASATVTPESAMPESAMPATVTPESAMPESAMPATVTPESAMPESAMPATVTPESAMPESAMPATVTPESAMPESAMPAAATSETATPDPDDEGSDADADAGVDRGGDAKEEREAGEPVRAAAGKDGDERR
ncbi:hypothetical protein FHU36_001413 [Nonomuraea muscovyensis]|uniref:DivIVA domain-containing protein n=1 Tax=Nonomuraea muscovyensis TaxID=1124761 RepID=A0A7X0BXT2_9ACTN|nr:hypothetical protein [Nonomuraea muscovyensis]MBB6344904.1 hypothetical protein [Nonomuraea muscovyensis]